MTPELAIPMLRPSQCVVIWGESIAGNAPKNLIRLYEYGVGTKRRPSSWPTYIAKVGKTNYPVESITEHLFTRIGQEIGLDIADSRLLRIDGQVRFLSRFFRKREETLVHGAEIFSQYLNDPAIVDEIEAAKLDREFLTFQFAIAALRDTFGAEIVEQLIEGFVTMIGFDAIVGNADRHHFNWGIITHDRGLRPPRFSPVFDTARGLYWDHSDEQVAALEAKLGGACPEVDGYINRCRAKVGWEGQKQVKQFDLIEGIVRDYPEYRRALRRLAQPDLVDRVAQILNEEFTPLMTYARRRLILSVLSQRLHIYARILEKEDSHDRTSPTHHL